MNMKLLLLSFLFSASCIAPMTASNVKNDNSHYLSIAQNSNCDASVPSNGFQGGRQCSANNNWSVATDIIVTADNNLTITQYTPSVGMNPGVTATSVRVRIHNNANGKPGLQLSTQTIIPTSQTLKGSGLGVDFSDVLLDLEPITLAGSAGSAVSYWIAIQVTTSNGSTAYIETANVGLIGAGLAFSDGGGFIIPDDSKEGVYSLIANCSPMEIGVFPYPYCGPLVYGTVEPITLVNVAGINNVTSATIGGTPSHQDFVTTVGQMNRGQTYEITLKGNTSGDFINSFTVFIDWNQNSVLNNIGEVFIIEPKLINSTGSDEIQILRQITVPENAILGETRMRVIKIYGEDANIDPCAAGASWGQAEDYTIKVSEALGVNDVEALAGFSYSPNPSTEVLNLQASKNIESIALYNLLGQQVYSAKVDATSSAINISHLNTATYILKVTVDGKIGTYKVIKN